MRKLVLLALPLLLLAVGCTTPQAVNDDLNMVKENIMIQKRVSSMLLLSVKPQNDKQAEALATKTMDVEQRYDHMAAATNRLIIYFGSEKNVGYIVNVIDFMQASSLKSLLGLAEGERNDAICNEVLTLDYSNLLCDTGWLPSAPTGR
jgi:hypothetical protein